MFLLKRLMERGEYFAPPDSIIETWQKKSDSDMHELTICKNIIEILNKELKKKAFKQVKTIFLEVGKLALVEETALIFNFRVVAKGTSMENAVIKLAITEGDQIVIKSMEIS